MKKTILLLIVILLFGCRTKTVLVENTRNTRDSIENVTLKKNVTSLENKLTTASEQLQQTIQRNYTLIEQLNISESEKQNLKENIETTIREYNEQGKLIKETFTKKTSELQKDRDRQEAENRRLTDSLQYQSSYISYMTQEINRQYNENTELTKKLNFTENELKKYSQTNTAKPTSWRLPIICLLIGLAAGIAGSLYLKRIFPVAAIKKIFTQIKKTL